MHSISNSINVSSTTGGGIIALSLLACTFSFYYIFHDRRFTLSERFYYLICKRNMQEALLEHELLQQGWLVCFLCGERA